MKFLILNGPNINLTGIRETDIYGKKTYADLLNLINEYALKNNIEVCFYQSNHEGDLVDKIQEAYYHKFDGIVFNPAAYTHTSIAIADAVKGTGIPTVEVHISDLEKRESFRQISYVRSVCKKTISGHGFEGYTEALEFLINYIGEKNES